MTKLVIALVMVFTGCYILNAKHIDDCALACETNGGLLRMDGCDGAGCVCKNGAAFKWLDIKTDRRSKVEKGS